MSSSQAPTAVRRRSTRFDRSMAEGEASHSPTPPPTVEPYPPFGIGSRQNSLQEMRNLQDGRQTSATSGSPNGTTGTGSPLVPHDNDQRALRLPPRPDQMQVTFVAGEVPNPFFAGSAISDGFSDSERSGQELSVRSGYPYMGEGDMPADLAPRMVDSDDDDSGEENFLAMQ